MLEKNGEKIEKMRELFRNFWWCWMRELLSSKTFEDMSWVSEFVKKTIVNLIEHFENYFERFITSSLICDHSPQKSVTHSQPLQKAKSFHDIWTICKSFYNCSPRTLLLRIINTIKLLLHLHFRFYFHIQLHYREISIML